MNKAIKFVFQSILVVCIISTTFADEAESIDTTDAEITDDTVVDVEQNVSVRMSCDEINAEITRLRGITEPNDSETSRLADMQARHRKNCTMRAGNRAAINRNGHVVVTKDKDEVPNANVKQSAESMVRQEKICALLPDFIKSETDINNKTTLEDWHKKYCIDKQVASDEVLGVYEFLLKPVQDANADKKEAVDNEKIESVEEIKAKAAANTAAGLCENGDKPNKFGCCDGEKFKDLGNGKFGCCKMVDGSEQCHNSLNKF